MKTSVLVFINEETMGQNFSNILSVFPNDDKKKLVPIVAYTPSGKHKMTRYCSVKLSKAGREVNPCI